MSDPADNLFILHGELRDKPQPAPPSARLIFIRCLIAAGVMAACVTYAGGVWWIFAAERRPAPPIAVRTQIPAVPDGIKTDPMTLPAPVSEGPPLVASAPAVAAEDPRAILERWWNSRQPEPPAARPPRKPREPTTRSLRSDPAAGETARLNSQQVPK